MKNEELVDVLPYDGYNDVIHKNKDIIGTVVPQNGRWGITNGWKIIEIYKVKKINMEKIKVFTAFSGYDSQCMALDRLKENFPGFDYELVGWSEIDKYAIEAHNAVYPQWKDRNFGDISKIDWDQVPDFDLFTYSSPCQDFSNAGLQKGAKEGSGTRSSLLWECRKAILAKHPKFLLFENVKAVVSNKFMPTFQKWCDELTEYGYSNFWQVLNAKDYGVPQNRERIYMVSIKDVNAFYYFPEPFELEERLKDVLENNVDEKFYLKEETIKSFTEHCKRKQNEGCGFKFEPTDGEGYAKCLSTLAGSRQTDNFIKENNAELSTIPVKNPSFIRTAGPGGDQCCLYDVHIDE